MALVWENLSCDGKGSLCTRLLQGIACAPKKNEMFLSNVSGSFNFGELTAFMGPSGAGKSILLKCLTRGKNYPGVQGRIAVSMKTNVRACIISQNDKDHLLLNLTVTEALLYASQMKNPSIKAKIQHSAIVHGLLSELDLLKAKNTLIAKCSGGQRKRLAIGLELTPKVSPNFLFMDEPTSGLDSYSIMALMRELAIGRSIAIGVVIHQRSLEIFSLFHNVYVLTKDGRCVYHGNPVELRQLLADSGYITMEESSHTNPADVIIKIASSVGINDNTDLETLYNLAPSTTFKSAQDMQIDCENMMKKLVANWRESPITGSGRQIEDQGLCSYSADFTLYTLWALVKRTSITSIWRQKQYIFIRLTLNAVMVVILVAVYNRNIGRDDACVIAEEQSVIQNCSTCSGMRTGSAAEHNLDFQFASLMFLMFSALMPTVLTFPDEIKLFINEHRNGWYSTSCYYISKTLVEIPFQMVLSFFYVYFLYWYSQQLGMDNWYSGFMSWRYAYYLGVTIISCFIAQGLGFLVGILCGNSFLMAVILSSNVLLFQILFSGFFVKLKNLSSNTHWITYFSFIRFSFESLLIIIYGDDRCEFLPNSTIPAKSAIMGWFGLSDEDLTVNFCWLIVHLLLTRIIAFILLRNVTDQRFMKLPTSCQFFFDKLLSWHRELIVKVGKIVKM